MTKDFKPLLKVVGTIIVEGLTLLAAASKGGKSSLMLDITFAVARGGFVLGDIQCPQGGVLYLSLEMSERAVQRRLTKMFGRDPDNPWPSFGIAYEWPRAHEGGIAGLKRWLAAHPETRLIVIDTFAMFRKPGDDKISYERDHRDVTELQQLANQHQVAVVILTHTRKADDEDPLNKVIGSVGAVAAADTVLVISKRGDGYQLYGRGRDVDLIDLALDFSAETNRWTIRGSRLDVQRSDERSAVLAVLIEAGQPLAVTEIAVALGKNLNTVRSIVWRMKAAGDLTSPEYGKYAPAPQPVGERTDGADDASS